MRSAYCGEIKSELHSTHLVVQLLMRHTHKPGLALLTAFLSRAEVIQVDVSSGTIDPSERPTDEDTASWYVKPGS
jgi:hypothetical protein